MSIGVPPSGSVGQRSPAGDTARSTEATDEAREQPQAAEESQPWDLGGQRNRAAAAAQSSLGRIGQGPGRALTLPDVPAAAKVTVKKGDTLSTIAKRARVPLATLMTANPHLSSAARKNGNLIFPGDEVVVPQSSRQATRGAAPTAGAGAGAEASNGAGRPEATTNGANPAPPAAASASVDQTQATAGAAPAAPTEATQAPVPKQLADQAKALVASGAPQSTSRVAAMAVAERLKRRQVDEMIEDTKANPGALVEQLSSPELADELMGPLIAAAAKHARGSGTLPALSTEVQTRLSQPAMVAGLENANRLRALPDEQLEQLEAEVQKLTPAQREDLKVATRLDSLKQSLEVAARVEEANGDPAKLVNVVLTTANFETAIVAVSREAKALGKLTEVRAEVRKLCEPAFAQVKSFKEQLQQIQKTQGDEAAQKLAAAPPETVQKAAVVEATLTALDDLLYGYEALGEAKDAAKQATVVTTMPALVLPLVAQELLDTTRAKGPAAVVALHDELAQLVAKPDSALARLRQQPADQQAAFFAKLSKKDQLSAEVFQKVERLRDVIRVEAEVTRAGTEPSKVMAMIEKAETPEEAIALAKTAVQDDQDPKVKALREQLLKLTGEQLKSFAPLIEKRAAATRAKQKPEALFDSLSPEEKAAAVKLERLEMVRTAAAEATTASMQKEVPKFFDTTVIKPGESVVAVASKALESQLGLGNKETFANAMKDVSPKLQELEAFTNAVLDDSKEVEAAAGLPLKALMKGLTPPGGRGELIVPSKDFSVEGGVLDMTLAHDVMIKVTDANNDVKYYALPTASRRGYGMPVPVANALRGAYERAHGVGDGEGGLFESALPSGATQKQINAAIDLLGQEDPSMYERVLKAYAYPATFNDYPLDASDLGTLLKDTHATAPDNYDAMLKGLVDPEKAKDPKGLVAEFKRMVQGSQEEQDKFKTLQERVAAMATTFPVAAVSFQPGTGGQPRVQLQTSLMGVKERSNVLADVDLGRMDGFAKAHGKALGQSIYTQRMLNATGPTTFDTRVALENEIAMQLEVGQSDQAVQWAQSEAGQKALAAGEMPDFVVYAEKDRPTVQAVRDQIDVITRARDPKAKPEVEVLPLIHLTRDGRTVPLKLFKVTGKDGPMFVDMGGNTYTSFKHYRESNQEAPGMILAPANGAYELDENGLAKVDTFNGGLTVTETMSMNWVNENILTVKSMDRAGWLLTGAGVLASTTVIYAGAGVALMAIGRKWVEHAAQKMLMRRVAQRAAGEALFQTSRAAYWLTQPLATKLAASAAGRFAMQASVKTTLAGGLGFMTYGLYNTGHQFGWVNEHSQLGLLDTWGSALDDSQQGYMRRQVLAGGAMSLLGAVAMGSGLKLGQLMRTPERFAAAVTNQSARGLANTALYSNAVNVPLTGFMTWDMYNYRRRFGGMMDNQTRHSLDTNVMMNMVGGITGLLTAVDNNALRLRGTPIPQKHLDAAIAASAKGPIERLQQWASRGRQAPPSKPSGTTTDSKQQRAGETANDDPPTQE